jgi:hypothetical protein
MRLLLLRRAESMTLLHLLARAGCVTSTAAILGAGCMEGHIWRLHPLPAAHHHLTALHLAAVLPAGNVAAAMIELLLHSVEGAGQAWWVAGLAWACVGVYACVRACMRARFEMAFDFCS